MNPLWGHFVGIFILLMMALFIGIWIWAWHGSHRPVFTRMAQLPVMDGASQETSGLGRAGNNRPGRDRPGRESHDVRRPAGSALVAANLESRP